jgi:hypothetical protein
MTMTSMEPFSSCGPNFGRSQMAAAASLSLLIHLSHTAPSVGYQEIGDTATFVSSTAAVTHRLIYPVEKMKPLHKDGCHFRFSGSPSESKTPPRQTRVIGQPTCVPIVYSIEYTASIAGQDGGFLMASSERGRFALVDGVGGPEERTGFTRLFQDISGGGKSQSVGRDFVITLLVG